MSEEFKNNNAGQIEQFKLRTLTGPQIFESSCDGVLMIEDINEVGNRFALPYFNFDTGQYLADYEKTLGKSLPSLYHVRDTWENFFELKQVIDKRFSEREYKNREKPFWKFW